MQLFPAECFIIVSPITFEQNVKRLNANFKDDFFKKMAPFTGSTYQADDTFYFRYAVKGKGGFGPAIKCVIKENTDGQTCEVSCRLRLHPIYWTVLLFFLLVTIVSVFLPPHHIAPLFLMLIIYAVYIFTFQFDVKRVKEKLQSVFSGSVA